MSTYAVQGPPHAGVQLQMATPGGTTGDLCPAGPGIALLVNNASAGTVTLTLPITPTYDGLAVASRTVAVPPGWTPVPLPSTVYGQGPQPVNYSSIGSVSVAAITIPG